MMFTAWEKGYAFQCFMEGYNLTWIRNSISMRSGKHFEEEQIQQMIIQYIKENLENE